MFPSIWQKLTTPRAVNEDEKMREYMTRVILVMILGTLLVFTIFLFIGWMQGVFDFLPFLVMVGMVFANGTGLWLTIKGYWRWSSLLPPISFFLLGMFGTFSGGLVSTTILLYVLRSS